MSLLRVPAFIVALVYMYWSVPILCFSYKIRFLSFKGKRDDMFAWSEGMMSFFRASMYKVGSNELHRTSKPIMYLANHRCWADFFLDVYTTEGRSALLSRWAVFGTFPIFLAAALVIKGLIFFKRGVAIDKKLFNAMLDQRISSSPRSGLVVYPEGHRSLKQVPLPLKRGMLHYAHSRKMPVQVIITQGKELLLSETQTSVGFGAKLHVAYSEVIESSDFEGFDQFVEKVQTVWDNTWKLAYSAPAGSVKLSPTHQQGDLTIDMPPLMKTQQVAYCITAMSLLATVTFFTIKFLLSLKSVGILCCVGLLNLTVVSLQLSKIKPSA